MKGWPSDQILDMVKEMIITHTEVRIGFHFEIKSHHTPNAVQPRGSGWKELEQRMERTVRFTGPLVQILSEVGSPLQSFIQCWRVPLLDHFGIK